MNKKITTLLPVAALLALTAGCSHSQLDTPANQANNTASAYGENQPIAVTDGQSEPIDGTVANNAVVAKNGSSDSITTGSAAPSTSSAPTVRTGTDGKPAVGTEKDASKPSTGDASLGASSTGRSR